MRAAGSASPQAGPGSRRLAIRLVGALSVIAVAGTAGWVMLSSSPTQEAQSPTQEAQSSTQEDQSPTQEVTVSAGTSTVGVTREDLVALARTRVFFGHQSVGVNILDGVRDLYDRDGTLNPAIQKGRTGLLTNAFVEHDQVGANEKPLLKVTDFEAAVRGGVGAHIDVALLKFCYIDFNGGTDVDAVFSAYQTMMTGLERDFPDVTFVKVTVPLTAEPGLKSRLKAWLRGSDGMDAASNVARERFNAKVRAAYAKDHLFDVAAAESTRPDGSRVSGTHEGSTYYALHPGYSSDGGHLNAEGSRVVAAAWVRAVNRAAAE